MVRHRLTDEQWQQVRPHIPVSAARTGRPARDPRQMLDGMLWVLATGAAWRDLPEETFGPWETVYYYFALWERTGVFFAILQALQLKLDERGKIDWSAWSVDGTNVRATRAAGRFQKSISSHELEPPDHALGYSRGGFGTKVHLVSDANGLPLAAELTAGQAHESTQAESVIALALAIQSRDGEDFRVPEHLLGDKGYSAERVREWLRGHGIEPVIARKDNESEREHETFDAETYRKRNVIERCVGWLKECRRFGTRFEKLAVRFLAMVHLAMIRRYLRA